VTSVRVSSAARGWQALTQASYDYWLAPSGMGAGPFTVQLTDSEGHQATVTGVTLTAGVVQPTRTWMYGAAAQPATPSASPRPTSAETAHRSTSGTPAASPAPAAPATVPAAAAAPATAAPVPSPSPC
jgi:hypothetical protein